MHMNLVPAEAILTTRRVIVVEAVEKRCYCCLIALHPKERIVLVVGVKGSCICHGVNGVCTLSLEGLQPRAHVDNNWYSFLVSNKLKLSNYRSLRDALQFWHEAVGHDGVMHSFAEMGRLWRRVKRGGASVMQKLTIPSLPPSLPGISWYCFIALLCIIF